MSYCHKSNMEVISRPLGSNIVNFLESEALALHCASKKLHIGEPKALDFKFLL